MDPLKITLIVLLIICVVIIIGLSVYFTSQGYIDSVSIPPVACTKCAKCEDCPAQVVCPKCETPFDYSRSTQIKIGDGANEKCVQPLNDPSGTNADYLTKNRIKLAACDPKNPLQSYTFTPIKGKLGRYSICNTNPVEFTGSDGKKEMRYSCLSNNTAAGNTSNWDTKDRSTVTDGNLSWNVDENQIRFVGAAVSSAQGKLLSVSSITDNATLPLSSVSSDKTKFKF